LGGVIRHVFYSFSLKVPRFLSALNLQFFN
jgi:hypothetical protein